MSFRTEVFTAAAVSATVFLSIPAFADPLPEPWQSKREAGIRLTQKACKGDQSAIDEVWHRIKNKNDPVVQNGLGWLASKCQAFKHVTEEEQGNWQMKAALQGYPIAMSNYANRLMRGLGVQQDVKTAVTLHERAISEGYGISAEILAHHYAKGKYLPRDLNKAQAYLKKAEREGVAKARLDGVRNIISTARAEKAPNAAPPTGSQSGNTGEIDHFAALAVSKADGGFGWAYDHESRTGAQERARNECREKGGSDCDVVMVGKGQGCMAYHYAGKPATAYGWGISRDRQSAASKAAEECRIRNGNVSCQATSWVCNTRTTASLEVVYEAPLPPVTPAGAGVDCDFHVSYHCKIPGNKTGTTFAYESFRVGKKIRIPGAESCKAFRKSGSKIYGEFKGETYRRPGIFDTHADRLIGLVRQLKAEAEKRYPGCRSYHGVEIAVGNQGKTTFNSKPSRMNYDNGTPRYSYFNLE